MAGSGHVLRWNVYFDFATPGWFADLARTQLMLDVFAASAWFAELSVFGIANQPGVRFGALDEVRSIVVSGQPGKFAFVRGDNEAAAAPELAEAALRFEILPRVLFVTGNVRGDALSRLGPRALDDFLDAIVALDDAWRDIARLAGAAANPSDLPYARVRPVRDANAALHSIAEVFEPAPTARAAPQIAAAARAMAAAAPPTGVERTPVGRLIMQRWMRDPSDPVATAQACSRHEAWLVSLLDLPIAPGWNAAGEQHVSTAPLSRDAAPLDLYDAGCRAGFQRVSAAGDDRWLVAERVASARRLADGREVDSVAVIAPDASAVAGLRPAAVRSGFTRVLYPGGQNTLWDPDPPGDWVLVPPRA